MQICGVLIVKKKEIEHIMISIDLTALPTPRKSEEVVKPEIAKVE
jgi:hypothetical protein